MYDEVVILVKQEKTIDEYGDSVISEVERVVFAGLRSIGQAEFYQAQASGLAPEIKFILPDYLEYQGEQIIKYQGFNDSEPIEYHVVRTYRNGNELEITCSKGVVE